MNGWHIFSFFLGAFCCIVVLGWQTYKDSSYDEDDGVCWDDDTTTEYNARLQDR